MPARRRACGCQDRPARGRRRARDRSRGDRVGQTAHHREPQACAAPGRRASSRTVACRTGGGRPRFARGFDPLMQLRPLPAIRRPVEKWSTRLVDLGDRLLDERRQHRELRAEVEVEGGPGDPGRLDIWRRSTRAGGRGEQPVVASRIAVSASEVPACWRGRFGRPSAFRSRIQMTRHPIWAKCTTECKARAAAPSYGPIATSGAFAWRALGRARAGPAVRQTEPRPQR